MHGRLLKASLSPRFSGLQLVATGPARGLQDSNCNLSIPDFFGGRPSQQAAG